MSEYESVVTGVADGALLILTEPLSFWGGVDPKTGEIIDVNHPQCGTVLAGHIVAMPHGRGSSSASSILAEAVRRGTAPAALVLDEPDPILAIGSLVAQRLYGTTCAIVVGPVPGEPGDRVSIIGEKLEVEPQ